MRTKPLLEAFKRNEIRASSVLVYMAIYEIVRKGEDRPSNIAIANACGYKPRMVKLAKTELAAAGFIELEVIRNRGPIPSKVTLV